MRKPGMTFTGRANLCIDCRKACGGCSWSRDFEPVEGWVAERTDLKLYTMEGGSYKIKYCPEFEQDETERDRTRRAMKKLDGWRDVADPYGETWIWNAKKEIWEHEIRLD